MYPRSQERRRNREATVYLPALGGAGLGLIVRSESLLSKLGFSVRNLLSTPAVLFTHDRETGSLCAHC